MTSKYTTDRWTRLCELTQELSGREGLSDAMELRPRFEEKEEWEFAMSRLLSLGRIFWLDLSPTEREIAQSAYIATRREGASPEAVNAEIEMLYAPMQCVAAGSPVRVLPERVDHDIGWEDKAPVAEFGLFGFVKTEDHCAFQLAEPSGNSGYLKM